MGILVPVPVPASHDALSIVFSSQERDGQESIRFKNRRLVKGKGNQQLVTKLPRESRCSDRESGDRPFGWEWVPLSCGRGIGERGLSRAESCGGFRLEWAPNPAAGRLASEAAAFPQLCCCLSGGGAVQVQLVSLETKTRREIRDRQQKPKAKRVETSCGFPTEEGKGCRRRHGICRLSLGVHTTVEYVCMYCLLDGKLSSRVGCQIKSV